MKYVYKPLLLLTVLFTSYNNTFAQSKIMELDSVVATWTNVAKYNGTAMVVKGKDTLLMKGYGPKDVNRNYACDPNTLFQIGQITEVFTSALVFKLQEDGLLSIKDKVSKYYPDFPHGDKITIEHLLTNTAGIPDYMKDDSFFLASIHVPRSRNDVLRAFYNKPLNHKPGSKHEISQSNYAMLGYIIEKVTGQKYYIALRERLLNEIGTTNTGFNFGGYASWDKAKGYQVLNKFRVLRSIPLDSTVGYASAGLFSGAKDLMRFAKAVINKEYLSAESWDKATTEYKDDYAYGWQIKDVYGKKAIGHIGITTGFVSNFLIIPEDSLTVILLGNDMENEINRLQADVLAAIYDQPYELPKPKPVLRLSERILEDYVGRYELPNGDDINFYIKNGLLYGRMIGQDEFTMLAEKVDKFYIQPVDMEFTFVRNDKNEITDVIVRRLRTDLKAHKWQ